MVLLLHLQLLLLAQLRLGFLLSFLSYNGCFSLLAAFDSFSIPFSTTLLNDVQVQACEERKVDLSDLKVGTAPASAPSRLCVTQCSGILYICCVLLCCVSSGCCWHPPPPSSSTSSYDT